MFNIVHRLLLSLPFLICLSLGVDFSPSTDDYNAYGLKMAANNLMIVEAINDYNIFLVQFAPYTDNITESDLRSCYLLFEDSSTQYIYSVALGRNQSTYDIFFVGEVMGLDEDDQIENRTFVGVLSYKGSNTTIKCNLFTYQIQYVSIPLPHQEHLVMVTDPSGSVAYGFSDLFTFSYTPATDSLIVHQQNSLSPTESFFPLAVDYDGNLSISTGFLDNGRNSRIKYIATIILFNISTVTGISTPIRTWSYPINGTSWQAGQTNSGADKYEAKFSMSVSMNPITKQVLVGMQSLNTVFLFNYTTTSLTFITSVDNGQGIGFGKGVAWLNYTLNSFAILANVYSMDYDWKSSKIYVYERSLQISTTPVSIFPNIQQPLYSYLSSILLNIITTSGNLVILDSNGYLFGILSASAGYYASTVGPNVEISPAFSTQLPCIAGTFKNVTGIRRCFPCSPGTKNDGSNPLVTTCTACTDNVFCPLGSSTDSISNDMLNNVIQATAYPPSPEISELDDMLFFTLFSLSSTPRCIPLSPVFWTLMVAAIVIPIGIIMLIIKRCVKKPKATTRYKKVVRIFKQTDLIGEGELWIGGLATFCVLVIIISCYVFSGLYYNSYPLETTGPSTYTCDTSIRNAKFSTALQSLAVPTADNLQEMMDLLNQQTFYLNVAFINTIYDCTSDLITADYLLGSTWTRFTTNLSCNALNYILSLSIMLPFRPIQVRFSLPNIYMIGGVRVGLSGPGQVESSTTTLRDLDFSQTFSKSDRMLGQNPNIAIELSKVINDTLPLATGGDEIVSGLWIGSFKTNYYESFYSDTDYFNTEVQSSTNLTVDISETSYYIANVEEPAARLPQLIFHNFLFTTMIIELFGLVFLLFKLVILPLLFSLIRRCKPDFGKRKSVDSDEHRHKVDDDLENPHVNSNFNGPYNDSPIVLRF